MECQTVQRVTAVLGPSGEGRPAVFFLKKALFICISKKDVVAFRAERKKPGIFRNEK